MTRTRYALPIIVLAALTAPASAAQVTLTDTWQNLGAGPLLLQTQGGDGLFEASSGAPTDNGLALGKNQTPFGYNSTLTIWAKRRSTSYTTSLTYSPLTLATGGGSGGTSALPPQAVTMTTTNNAITGNAAAVTPLQINNIRKYLNVFNSTGGACRYGYGTTNAAPTSTVGMPLPAAVGFTLEASAITYQSMSFWCAQTGTIDITEGQ